MAAQTISTLASLARPNVKSGVVDLLFRKTPFFDLLRASGRVEDGQGPTPFKWNLVYSGGTTEVFVEGQALPAVSRQTFTQASLDAFYVRGLFGLSGHAKDNAAKGGFYDDPKMVEEALMKSDVFKKIEDTLLSSTQDQGIAGIIDSSGTYAGISASTITQWASEENGSISTLDVADMEDLYEELVSAAGGSSVPRGNKPTTVLAPPNQVTNYIRTIGSSASTPLVRLAPGGAFDAGFDRARATFQGLPVVEIAGITATEMYMVDINDLSLLVHRDLRIDPVVGSPEEENYQVSTAVCLKVEHRNWHGKMTGITS